MSSRRHSRLAWTAAAAAILLAAAALLVPGEPGVVWCRLEEAGGAFSFQFAPDGDEVPHAATMTSPDVAWAYYYPVPGAAPGLVGEILGRLGLDPATTVNFVPTGRETTTPSGRWRELRRCGDEEFESVMDAWRRDIAARR